MSTCFESASCWGYAPMTAKEKKENGTLSYANDALNYFRLEPKHFTVLKDNKQVRVDVSVEFRVCWMQEGRYLERTWHVPAGYIFDGASIPPIFWDLIGEPDDQEFLIAALIHDFLYERRWNRKMADAAFRNFLIKEGVWGFKASVMWAAVRLGGFSFYAGDTSKFWAKVRNFLD